MKITDLVEMTMRVPSYENMGTHLSYFQQLKQTGIHCGDIEEFNVFKQSRNQLTDYAVFEQTNCVAFFVLDNNELENAYVIPEKRKIGIFSMFLFFLKKNEGLGQIILGNRHSEQTIEALNRIYKRFKTYWIKDNQKIPYDPKTINQFYSIEKPTGWKIMLENDGDFSKEPKFFDGKSGGPPPDVHTIYRWFLDA